MGFFANRALRKAIEPVGLELGTWTKRIPGEYSALSASQIVGLGVASAVATTPDLRCTSSTATDGQVNRFANFLSSEDSLLRYQGGTSAIRTSLGALARGFQWLTDWKIRIPGEPGGQKVLTVPDYRTMDDEIANVSELKEFREYLRAHLLDGPRFEVSDTIPGELHPIKLAESERSLTTTTATLTP